MRVLAVCGQPALGAAPGKFSINESSGPHEIVPVSQCPVRGSSLRVIGGLPLHRPLIPYLPLLVFSMAVANSVPLLLLGFPVPDCLNL